MRAVLRVVAPALAALVLIGCTGPRHEFALATGHAGAPGIQRILLAPMNAHSTFPDELKEGAKRTYEQVQRYLALHERTVSTTTLFRYRELSQLAAKAARGSENANGDTRETGETPVGSVDPFVRALASEFAADQEFDAIVIPDLVVRPARLEDGGLARWDGVKRQQKRSTGLWSGSIMAASLSIRVFNSDGKYVFSGFGGLDLLFQPSRTPDKTRDAMELVSDPLSNLKHLSQGVRFAFHPILALRK